MVEARGRAEADRQIFEVGEKISQESRASGVRSMLRERI
jgi:hypothetical protein